MIDTVKNYTQEWNEFQIRSPVYLDGHFDPYKYDVVKWEYHEPYEVINFYTGRREVICKNCFTIGMLIWNYKSSSFNFESCGLRYLQYRINGLEEFILDFCNKMKNKLKYE